MPSSLTPLMLSPAFRPNPDLGRRKCAHLHTFPPLDLNTVLEGTTGACPPLEPPCVSGASFSRIGRASFPEESVAGDWPSIFLPRIFQFVFTFYFLLENQTQTNMDFER